MRRIPTVLVALTLPILGACGVQAGAEPSSTPQVSQAEARSQVEKFLIDYRLSGITSFDNEDDAFQNAINLCEAMDRRGINLATAIDEISTAAANDIRNGYSGSREQGSDMAAFFGIAVDSFCPQHGF